MTNTEKRGAVLLVIVLAVALAGCTLVGGDKASDTAVREELAARLAETRDAQAAALALWDRVIVGETVSCVAGIPVPEPVTLTERQQRDHPSAAAIQAELNAAIQAVHASSDLWNIECNDARPLVPLEMAREGRATALAAGESLDAAAALLAGWAK